MQRNKCADWPAGRRRRQRGCLTVAAPIILERHEERHGGRELCLGRGLVGGCNDGITLPSKINEMKCKSGGTQIIAPSFITSVIFGSNAAIATVKLASLGLHTAISITAETEAVTCRKMTGLMSREELLAAQQKKSLEKPRLTFQETQKTSSFRKSQRFHLLVNRCSDLGKPLHQ